MSKVITSWEVDFNAERWKWGIGFLSLRGFHTDAFVYQEPDSERLRKQVECLVEWSMGSRNWIVCISKSSVYIRLLFDFVLASYVFSTGKRAIAVDVDDLIHAVDNPDGEKRDIIEFAELLLVNYCDPNNPQLRWRKGAIANVLHRRKYNRYATMFNLFVREILERMDSNRAIDLTKGIVDVFGDTAYELFTDINSKRVVVRDDGGNNGERKRARH